MPSSPLALFLRSRGQQGNREEELNMQMDGRKQEADMRRGRRRYGQEGGQKEHSRIQEIYFGQQEGEEDVELAARCDINPHQHLVIPTCTATLPCPLHVLACSCLLPFHEAQGKFRSIHNSDTQPYRHACDIL